MSNDLSKTDRKVLDMIDALPDKSARVASRGDSRRGLVAQATADRLVAAGVAEIVDGRVTTDQATWEAGGQPDTAEPDTTTPEADPSGPVEVPNGDDTPAPKVNGRKAKADASPYSTATPTNRIKREGKSRRTGTMTEIEDGLAKGSTFQVDGSDRYAIRCLSHGAETFTPDMTTAKPLQARTDEFCLPCRELVKAGDKHTEPVKAS